MRKAKLKDLFDYLPKSKVKAGDGLKEGMHPFYTSSENQTKYLNEYQHGPGCLVFGTGGKASVHFTTCHFSTSTDCIAIKSKQEVEIDVGYVFQYFKGNMHVLENGFKGAGLKHISKAYLSDIQIPYPEDIDEQRRIAHLLGKVEGVIAQCKQHLQQLDDLLKSVFLEMFGDPVRNDKGWSVVYWDNLFVTRTGKLNANAMSESGAYPFFTCAKEIFRIDSFAFNCEALILAGNNATGDYDVKYYKGKFNAYQRTYILELKTDTDEYAFFKHHLEMMLRQLKDGSKGANTRYLTKQFLGKIAFIRPGEESQKKFSTIAKKVEALKSRYKQSLTNLEALYGVLSQQAFKGELDLSRVAVPAPAQHIADVTTGDQTTVPEPVAQALPAIDLRDTDNLLAALESAEERKNLLVQWLEVYRSQLRGASFSVQHFMTVAQTRLAELHPDGDFELGTNDYECIKAWVFEALAAGWLAQAFDDAGNRIELKVPTENNPA